MEDEFGEEDYVMLHADDKGVIEAALEVIKATPTYQSHRGDLDVNLTRGVHSIQDFLQGKWWQ